MPSQNEPNDASGVPVADSNGRVPTEPQRRFLSLLAQHDTTIARKYLPLADRVEDRVRQSCRRNKWAQFGRWEGDLILGWRITDAGRAALALGSAA